jgi:hypothetical protein
LWGHKPIIKISLAGDVAFFYGGYLAVKNNAGLGYTLRLGIDAETMYRFVGTQTDNRMSPAGDVAFFTQDI